jgi:hypothetical protein
VFVQKNTVSHLLASKDATGGQGFEFTRFSVLGFNARCWTGIVSSEHSKSSALHYLQQVGGFGESLNLWWQ